MAAQPERWFMLCLAVPLTVTSALRCWRRSPLVSFFFFLKALTK